MSLLSAAAGGVPVPERVVGLGERLVGALMSPALSPAPRLPSGLLSDGAID